MTPVTEIQKLLSTQRAVRNEILVNPGNRYLEYINSCGQMIRLPNVIRDFDISWEDVPAPSDDTAIIEREGRIYAIGQAAKTMHGRSAFDKGKLSMMQDSIFAALEPSYGQSILRVEDLKIAVPDTRSEEAKAESQKLQGTFEYTRNGQALIATIARVTLIEEATAAYNYGIENGLYQWSDAINGVIDFGGGTSSGRLYSPDGLMLREASITLPGTNQLAQSIQARLLKETDASTRLGKLPRRCTGKQHSTKASSQ